MANREIVGHEFDASEAADAYRIGPRRDVLVRLCRAEFAPLFCSSGAYEQAEGAICLEFVLYSKLCNLIGRNELRRLLFSGMRYVWRAYQKDRNATLAVMARSAADGDEALAAFWSLVTRYKSQRWRDDGLILRDRAAEILAFAAEYIEGVLKKELWPVLSYRDIASGSSKNPMRWQSARLGNMVSSAASLPAPLGPFLGRYPVPDVSLNRLRNVGAHKDFDVARRSIILCPDDLCLRVSLSGLETALDTVGESRGFLKLLDTVANLQDVEGLIRAGYRPSGPPEAAAMSACSSLGFSGVYVSRLRRTGHHTELDCSTDRVLSDEDLLLTVLQQLATLATAYSDVFERTKSGQLRIRILRESDGTTLTASCSLGEVLEALNAPGRRVVEFELSANGHARRARLTVDIGVDALPLV